jgi:hypothetical protein
MRMITILAAGATLAFATAANAQEPPAQQPSAPAPAAAPASPKVPTIQNVDIVDVNELPEATRTQVNKMVAQRGDADLQKLRASIDASPEIKSLLEAKGLSPAQVIVASLGEDGTLTLVTQKAS